MEDITVIILTYNESKHIQRCIESVQNIAKEIFVVDSYSQDKTVQLAESLGAKVVQHPFDNQAKQFNWALENLPIQTAWVLRLDADEYITPELAQEMLLKVPQLSEEITGVILPFRRVFLGREIKRGTGGIKMLRLFRYRKAVCEQRWMDEHIQLLEGMSVEFDHDFADDNLNNLSWWTQKHVAYAHREAIDLLDMELGLLNNSAHQDISQLSEQAAAKRRKKLKYARQPLFWRAFAYFLYRYIFKLGFLEGKEGFLWHFLQGWWYRTLVDAKVWEIKRACGSDVEKIRAYIKEEYKIEL
ncbi:glycosyltransferase family 2 protein [Fontibacter flavus]|uniref:Glycosyltransferase family 2 protein n=1 Tax=Fontibacter flavus TaxID=654838 RepID=A0ABV6FVK8_9BACT